MHYVPSAAGSTDLDQNDLDRVHPRREVMSGACKLILDIVDRFASAGAPMWPLVPSSVYGKFLRRELAGERVSAIIWDSSAFG